MLYSPPPHIADRKAVALNTKPKEVALVALGPSTQDYHRECIGSRDENPFDEVWVINRGFRTIVHDKVFLMDDLRWIEQKDPAYGRALQGHDRPIITCRVHPDYPMSVEYPLQKVLNTLGDDAFGHNSVAYAVAYAMVTGVKNLSLYGCDFFYNDDPRRDANKGPVNLEGRPAMVEEGAQIVTYLLGLSKSFGMRFRLPQSTTLLNANKVQMDPGTNQMFRPLYGYHRKHEVVSKPPHPMLAGQTDGQSPSPPLRPDRGHEPSPPDAERSVSEVEQRRWAASVHTERSTELGGGGDGDEGFARLVFGRSPEGPEGSSGGGWPRQGNSGPREGEEWKGGVQTRALGRPDG